MGNKSTTFLRHLRDIRLTVGFKWWLTDTHIFQCRGAGCVTVQRYKRLCGRQRSNATHRPVL